MKLLLITRPEKPTPGAAGQPGEAACAGDVEEPGNVSASQARALQLVASLATEGWAVCDDFVDLRDVRSLAARARRLLGGGNFRRARVGRGESFRLETETRNDRILWIEPNEGSAAERRYAASIEDLRLAINQQLYQGLFEFETHYAVYEPGAFYRTHIDRFRDAAHRTVSCILYLNEAWNRDDGGQLRLYLDAADCEPYRDVEPVAGRLVTFFSDRFPHEVLAAKRERLSLSGWLGRRH